MFVFTVGLILGHFKKINGLGFLVFQKLGYVPVVPLVRSLSVSGFGVPVCCSAAQPQCFKIWGSCSKLCCAALVFQGLGFHFQAPLRSLSVSESRASVLALLLLPDVVSYCFTKCFAITVRNYCPPIVPHRVYSSQSIL